MDRGQCCGPRNNRPNEDCGNGNNPTGPAANDIRQFGNDETAWLTEFLTAWVQVTGNGFTNLRRLVTATTPVPTTAPTPVMPTSAPTPAPTRPPPSNRPPNRPPAPTPAPTRPPPPNRPPNMPPNRPPNRRPRVENGSPNTPLNSTTPDETETAEASTRN